MKLRTVNDVCLAAIIVKCRLYSESEGKVLNMYRNRQDMEDLADLGDDVDGGQSESDADPDAEEWNSTGQTRYVKLAVDRF